jgi:hypothetical protein
MAALAQQEPGLDAAERQEVTNTPRTVRRATGALLTLVFAATAAAQTPAATLARLRAADLALAEAQALVPALQTAPVTLRLQASDALRAGYLLRVGRHAKACADLGKAIAAAAPRRAEQKAGRKPAVDPVDGHRSRALAASRRADLSKETITAVIDPEVQALEGLLWPTRDALVAKAPALQSAFEALRGERAELPDWYALYGQSTAGLELHPDAEKHFAKNPPPPPPLPLAGLDDEWIAWTLLAMPLAARDRSALEANETLRATMDPEEMAGNTALNRLRWLLGLPVLRIDAKLAAAARDHSLDMETLGFFAHESPVAGKKSPGDRAARFGTSGGAENIANGQQSGQEAVQSWWYSPGHHRNMLGGHGRVGLGRHARKWTQMFGG